MLPQARKALNGLLDRYEANPASTRLHVRVDGQDLPTRRDHDTFVDILEQAAAGGALVLVCGTGRERRVVRSARLVDPAPLYAMLGRTPSATLAEASIAPMREAAAGTWRAAAFADVEATWAKGRDWWGIPMGDAMRLRKVADLAAGIVAGRHEGYDYRTFSREMVQETKFLERHEQAVVRFARHGREIDLAVRPRLALSVLGLDRIAIPFHLAGPLTLGGVPMPAALPYLAVPHEAAGLIGFSRAPRLLLTIENMVSFHRHALEADPGRDDLVIFTGGQPSLSFQRSLAMLVALLPAGAPRFHWSDIDAGGIEIFKTMDRLLGGVRPHLMSVEIAAERGETPPSPACRPGQAAGTALAGLADWLATPQGRILEQEALDPVAPELR